MMLRLITVISPDVYPPRALHHPGPLQDVVVGLPLHLMLQGAHLALRLSVRQVPCGRRKGGQCERHEGPHLVTHTGGQAEGSTCCKHQSRLDHFHGVGAELLKIRNAPRVVEPADVDVRHLEHGGTD